MNKAVDQYESEIRERFTLAVERLNDIPDECNNPSYEGDYYYPDFFMKKAEELSFLLKDFREYGIDKLNDLSEEQLLRRNKKIYEDILPQNYEESYSNPDYAEDRLGIYGGILSFLSAELMTIPVMLTQINGEDGDNELSKVTYLLELFLYIYGLFKDGEKPNISEVESAVYYYAFDYIEEIASDRILENTFPNKRSAAARILEECDLSDTRYLYMYGDYISDNEIKLSRYLSSLSDNEIDRMAFTFTDGFRRGFDVMNISFEGKKYVNIRYHIGQERIVRTAIKQFREMGLEPVLSRSITSRLTRKGTVKPGIESTSPNMQFEFDHRLDDRFFLDKRYVQRRLDVVKDTFEGCAEDIKGYAGPAVIETFGEKSFTPVVKDSVEGLSDDKNALFIEMYNRLGMISNDYLPGDSYSFTIIAFPVPDIGEQFEDIFRDTMRVNTLDNDKYIKIQQDIIDVLDKADVVRVIGMNGNLTDMTVKMRKLKNPDKETQFENCTADVNIPLGEVFTSPVLKGSRGTLHVSRSYLNGYSFKDLKIVFEDGVVSDYDCDMSLVSPDKNAEELKADGRKYIKENILFNHETLPIGEFAIGTNTTAYCMALKYNILEKLPILIVEKTGPHFALGDTCYSHAEDHAVYNPDGKEIISRENDFSVLRYSQPEKAYFNCHTDITIPYNELGRLYTVDSAGKETDIIVEGRFVLSGTEELNEAL
ncbi:Thermophilic metalloprotease (M29) [Lachnospiraceae bacterium]|nr:Thermophilic metalloprotease (M29) [Lachnospiraceae bacterium]